MTKALIDREDGQYYLTFLETYITPDCRGPEFDTDMEARQAYFDKYSAEFSSEEMALVERYYAAACLFCDLCKQKEHEIWERTKHVDEE